MEVGTMGGGHGELWSVGVSGCEEGGLILSGMLKLSLW